MENSGKHKRFPIFCQLTNDSPQASRGLQIICEEPSSFDLQRLGQPEFVRSNKRSLSVQYATLAQAERACAALSQDFRVYYLPESLLERLSHRRFASDPSDSAPRTAKPPGQFAIDLVEIWTGRDVRTTVMIRNIPNKYSQQMLLEVIDKHCKEAYDFLYLPIDFKNKCNLGYAFINFLNPRVIPSFYEQVNGQKWERFNSEKRCELTYARIQGQAALAEHFQSSSVMHKEDLSVRPLIIYR